jgi:hypothetical protein
MEDVLEFFEKEFRKCQTILQVEARYCELYYEMREWADGDQERLELLRTRLEEAFAARYTKLQFEDG